MLVLTVYSHLNCGCIFAASHRSMTSSITMRQAHQGDRSILTKLFRPHIACLVAPGTDIELVKRIGASGFSDDFFKITDGAPASRS